MSDIIDVTLIIDAHRRVVSVQVEKSDVVCDEFNGNGFKSCFGAFGALGVKHGAVGDAGPLLSDIAKKPSSDAPVGRLPYRYSPITS